MGPTEPGRDAVQLVVTGADGTTCTVCVWLADQPDERRTGLMGVAELDQVDGMAFAYPDDVEQRFWMRDTLIPLDIAWFDVDGNWVSGATMSPCGDDVADDDCPRWGATGPYRLAVEVAAGQAAVLGLGPGSRAELGDPCPLGRGFGRGVGTDEVRTG